MAWDNFVSFFKHVGKIRASALKSRAEQKSFPESAVQTYLLNSPDILQPARLNPSTVTEAQLLVAWTRTLEDCSELWTPESSFIS